MRLFSRPNTPSSYTDNPLVPVVRLLGPKGKQAIYAATNEGTLKRRSWNGCAFNQAGLLLGETITGRRQAAKVVGTTPQVVSRFISVWDQLRGSDQQCTELLRDAILTVGLFTEPVPRPKGGEAAASVADAGEDSWNPFDDQTLLWPPRQASSNGR